MRRFDEFARARGLMPVAAFIPLDRNDTVSGLVAIAAATAEQRAGDHVRQRRRCPDPDRYYPPTPGCHPQAEGYRMIVESVTQALRPLLARTSAR